MCVPAIKVLVVDDSASYAAALRESLAAETCVEVIGIATGVGAAIDFLQSTAVDLVLSDVQMPDGGLAALMVAMRALDGVAQPKVIAMSGDVDRSSAVAGAFSVPLMDKAAGRQHLMACIDTMLCAE
jgi:DNA-binding NarL/FixJ family response regulator